MANTTRVKASRGPDFTLSRLPDGSINLARRNTAINIAGKADCANLFAALYDALYSDKES